MTRPGRQPLRGEVWIVDLEPAKGAELNKVRPVVVISANEIGALPLKLVAPITAWSRSKEGKAWLVPAKPTRGNGLEKTSCVDVLQMRGLDLGRFVRRAGGLSDADLDQVVAAIALVIEYV